MKKINKFVLIIVLILCVLANNKVFAAACPDTSGGNVIGVASGSGASAKITIGGVAYDASCIDAGIPLPTNEMVCSDAIGGYAELVNLVKQAGESKDFKVLALRIYTNITNQVSIHASSGKNQKIAQYTVYMNSNQTAEANAYAAKYPNIFGTPEQAAKAYGMARQALNDFNTSIWGSLSGNVNVSNSSIALLDIATFSDGGVHLTPTYESGGMKVIQCRPANGSTAQTWDIECETENECVDGFYPDGTPCEEEPPADECGTLTPQIHGGGHNCCSDTATTDEMWEDNLNTLFCENSALGVKFYRAKGGADYYLDPYANDSLSKMGSEVAAQCNGGADSIENYCQTYCTQRSLVTQPGVITATNGRYFKLKDINKKGTTSAYIESFKRCRTLIDYDKWYKQYLKYVDDEMKSYNEHQDYATRKELYDKMQEQPTGDLGFYKQTIGSHCAFTINLPGGGTRTEYRSETNSNDPDYPSGNIDHTFHFPQTLSTKQFEPVRLVPAKYEKAGGYTAAELEAWDNYKADTWCGSHVKNGTKYKYKHDSDTIRPDDWNKLNEAYKKAETKPYPECPSNCSSCSYNFVIPPEYSYCHIEESDVIKEKTIPKTLEDDSAKFDAATKNACNLEGIIAACDEYFVNENVTYSNGSINSPAFNAKDAFVLETDMNFSYIQTYVDESMRCVTDQQYVKFESPFGDKNCEVNGPNHPNGQDDLIGKEYSENEYLEGKEKLWDFSKDVKLEPDVVFPSFEGQRDKPYNADKIFNADARYDGYCYKQEGDFETKTTIPDGYTIVPDKSTSNKFGRNITIHHKQYYVYVTTLSGKYETFWEMTGVGERGVFDSKIMTEDTCSGHKANGKNLPDDMTCNAVDNGVSLNGPVYTCQLKVVSQVIETGKCNDPEVPNCEYEDPSKNIKKEGFNYFNFKLADPKNLFPNCNEYGEGSCNYAWNWLADSKGVKAKEEIEKDAQADLTYSPTKLTYSIKLSSKDIEAIREYNKAAGAYDDFNLDCEACPTDLNCEKTITSPSAENTCIEVASCKRCKSTFMSGLYNGTLSINNKTISITPQNGNLLAVRGNNKW